MCWVALIVFFSTVSFNRRCAERLPVFFVPPPAVTSAGDPHHQAVRLGARLHVEDRQESPQRDAIASQLHGE